MKCYYEIRSDLVRAVRFDRLGSGQWIEDLPLLAFDYEKGAELMAGGKDALPFLGKSSSGVVVCNPFESLDTLVADLEFAETYVRWFQQHHFIKKIALVPPLVAVRLVDYGRELYEVERRVIKEAFIHAGAREVWILPSDLDLSIEDLKKAKRGHILGGKDDDGPKVPQSIITKWNGPR